MSFFAAAVAPAIGKFLAKNGMKLLGGIFKGSVNKGVEKIAETIKKKTGIDITDAAGGELSDENILKLKEFELEYKQMLLDYLAEMRAQEIVETRIHQEDRGSAREMQRAALAQDDKFAKRFIYMYGALVTMATFGYIFGVTWFEVPAGNKRIVDTVLGFLLGVSLSAIIQFFFGSSKSSGDKQTNINELSEQVGRLINKK